MKEVGHFDICKAMAAAEQDIRVSPLANVTNLRKVKAGTDVTIGVKGDVVSAIGVDGKFVGGLLLIDRAQYYAMKKKLENSAKGAGVPSLLEAAESALELFSKGHALDNLNWGASSLTAENIRELNELPGKLKAAIQNAREGGR